VMMPMLIPLDASASMQLDRPDTLTIRISTGVGSGPTRLAAFDAALREAGVADFNLIRLSSIIPPQSLVVEVEGRDQLQGMHGDRLYCVYAEAYASTPFQEAWAGVAWSRRDDGSGDGLFVEHAGLSRSTVEHDLRLTLADLSRGRGGGFFDQGLVMTSAECKDHPVCALVIATYGTESWRRHDC
jgi:arginine decarboxylase